MVVVVIVVVVVVVVVVVTKETTVAAANVDALFLIEIELNRGKGVLVFVTAWL